jgi:hypothetical protein
MVIQPSALRAVFIEKPPGLTYSDAMSRLQLWLDGRKIQPSGFKITAWGRTGFELTFSRERDVAAAELFQWPPA